MDDDKTISGTFDQIEIDKFIEESLKMCRFKHSHVMGLIGVCLDGGYAPYIIMPYMANGSLLEYLKKEKDKLVFPDNAEHDEDQVYIITPACINNFCSLPFLNARFKKFASDW